MIHRHTNDHLTWIDLMRPTTEEIAEVLKEVDVPRDFCEDLTVRTQQTVLKARKGVFKLKLNIPVVRRTDLLHPHEVKFIATKSHLITVRFEEIESLHRFGKEFEVLSVLKTTGKSATGGHLLIALIDAIYMGLESKLDYLQSRIDVVEKEIFNQHEKEMLYEMSQISRRLIAFKQILSEQHEMLDSLPLHLESAFGKSHANLSVSLKNQFDHLTRRLTTIISTLKDLDKTNTSLLYTKQNEIMKILTILAFITFPLTLFTSTFGMNTEYTPIVGISGDFWFIIGIMIVVSLCFFGYFKYKKWM